MRDTVRCMAMTLFFSIASVIGALALYSVVFSVRIERRTPPHGRYVQAGRYCVHVVEAGLSESSAPRVLLVHGAASTSQVMETALAAALAPHARVISVDRPGCGRSPGFGDRERLATHADALAALLETLDGPPPVVVGHSYGAAVALRLALDHPAQVRAVVTVCAASHGYVGPVSWYNYLAAAPLVGRVVTRCLIPVLGPLMLKNALIKGFAPQSPPAGYRRATGLDLLFRPASFRANARDLVRANRELAVQQLRYPSLQAPIAVIGGAEDPTVLTERHSVPLAAAAPDARLAILPGVGHQAQLVAPDFIGEHVRALLNDTGTDDALPHSDATPAAAPAS